VTGSVKLDMRKMLVLVHGLADSRVDDRTKGRVLFGAYRNKKKGIVDSLKEMFDETAA